MKILVSEIDWDTDGISVDDLPDEVEIAPEEIVDPFDMLRIKQCIGRYDADIADYLSDAYGYCVNSFVTDILK